MPTKSETLLAFFVLIFKIKCLLIKLLFIVWFDFFPGVESGVDYLVNQIVHFVKEGHLDSQIVHLARMSQLGGWGGGQHFISNS